MARHEGDFSADSKALDLDELLALLDRSGTADERSREDAIACFLSGADGWKEARTTLGGTFSGEATGLRQRKSD